MNRPFKPFQIGELVVVNDLPDATLWKIIAIENPFGLIVKDNANPQNMAQRIDKSCAKRPTAKQLEQLED